LAAAIRARFGVEPELIPGSGGVFEVLVDGELVFSKRQRGRFPRDEEILTALAARQRD
jgi:selenoprotein W-related protein